WTVGTLVRPRPEFKMPSKAYRYWPSPVVSLNFDSRPVKGIVFYLGHWKIFKRRRREPSGTTLPRRRRYRSWQRRQNEKEQLPLREEKATASQKGRSCVAVVDLEEIGAKMNHCGMQQNAFAACEEMRAPFAFVDRKAPIFCPRPRRFSPLAAVADPLRPDEELDQLATSPPFFCGSPPSRAANPVIHDARFGENHPPALFAPSPLTLSGPPMSPKQGCAHAKFGLLPAAVRVEGFDSLNRDGRSCSGIAAVA
ncbi:hypothetical protein B296_00045841, partial [Ensete ventricosum]